MDANKKTAIMVGVLFILGTVAGSLCQVSTEPIRNAEDALVSVSANQTPIILSTLLWLTMGLALAVVPLVAFPILRQQNEALALGYVVFRGGLETVTYLATVVGWLALLPLSQLYQAGTPGAPALKAWADWLFRAQEIGSISTIVFCLGALIFYCLLYRSRLIPRWLSGWGLVAAIPYLAGGLLGLVGLVSPLSTIVTAMDLPLAVQEMVLALWLIVKGFNR